MKPTLRNTLLLAAVPALLTMAGCMQSSVNTSDELYAITQADLQWSAAAKANDANAFFSYYADDAVVLPPNAPILTSASAIRQALTPMVSAGSDLEFKTTKGEVAKSGDIGYLYGTYTLAMPDPEHGPGIHDTGKYVEVWKKQADGKWKCIVDTFNSDQPVPAPAPPAKKK